MKIPFHRPLLGLEESLAVSEVLQSNWLTTGSKTAAFEAAFKEYRQAPVAVAAASCTSGLLVLLKSLDIPSGSEVITTPYTFAASINVIIQAGLVPVLADIAPGTLHLDLDQVQKCITPRTRAILTVHVAGFTHRILELSQIAQAHNLLLIEDCAHAIEMEVLNKPAGLWGDGGVFSFYPNKNMTTGEGGMIISKHITLEASLRIWRNHGLSLEPIQRHQNSIWKQYDILAPGYKANLTDIQSAIGLVQLQKLQNSWQRRKYIFDRLSNIIDNIEGASLYQPPPDCKSAYHLAIIHLEKERFQHPIDYYYQEFYQHGIQCSRHFKPVHLFSYYQQYFGDNGRSFPVSEQTFDRVITWPLFPALTDLEIAFLEDKLQLVLTTES
ncbi:MAG: DegT/DnrJ/EryC1/StrS aminotransferase family protein [Bacteroidia bacterium]|nr:DegT/DnrJ/EryC1/StrS aminotransferase family protein [Bacteroidia bacterium]